MIVTAKPWTLDPDEWQRVLMNYVSLREPSRLVSTCRRTGHEIPAGRERVAFAIRRHDGSMIKHGFVCRDCIEGAKVVLEQGGYFPEREGGAQSPWAGHIVEK